MADRYGVKLAAGAEVFEWQGRACYKYNSKIKVAGDSVKVVFYEDGIMCGYLKNGKELAGSFEEPTRAKPVYDDEARLQRFIRTNKNAKARLHDYVKANLHKHKDNNGKKQSFKFMTLTFREDIRDLSVANKAFNAFIKRLNYHFLGEPGSFLRWVAVPELQEFRGVWHYHLLLFNMPFLPVSWQMVDTMIADGRLRPGYDKRNTVAYIWGNGGVDIKAVKFGDSYNVAEYLASYVGKGLEGQFKAAEAAGLLFKKRFLKSEGLEGPLVLVAFMDKAKRQAVFDYLRKHSKHFKKKGEGVYFDVFSFTAEWVGRVFGFDVRAPLKHIEGIQAVFDEYNYGFC